MLIILPRGANRRRKKLRESDAVPPPTGPLAVLEVQDITIIDGGISLIAVFNTSPEWPLESVATAQPEKWSARYYPAQYVGTSLELLDYQRVRINFAFFEENPDDPRLAYQADPSDIADAAGRELAAFAMPI